MSRSWQAAAMLLASLTAAGAARGQDWEFGVSPYFWGSNLKGDLALEPGMPVAHIEADFGDIFDDLEFGMMAAAEARRDRFVLLGDLIFADTGATSARSGGLIEAVNVDSQSFLAGAAGGYRMLDAEEAFLDLLVGARLSWISTDIELVLMGASTSSRDRDKSWVDGFVGARGRLALTERWSLTGYVDGGAGGSDSTWQAYATINYLLDRAWRLSGGYRYYSVDYEDGGFLYDVSQEGLLLGATLSFW